MWNFKFLHSRLQSSALKDSATGKVTGYLIVFFYYLSSLSSWEIEHVFLNKKKAWYVKF